MDGRTDRVTPIPLPSKTLYTYNRYIKMVTILYNVIFTCVLFCYHVIVLPNSKYMDESVSVLRAIEQRRR